MAMFDVCASLDRKLSAEEITAIRSAINQEGVIGAFVCNVNTATPGEPRGYIAALAIGNHPRHAARFVLKGVWAMMGRGHVAKLQVARVDTDAAWGALNAESLLSDREE